MNIRDFVLLLLSVTFPSAILSLFLVRQRRALGATQWPAPAQPLPDRPLPGWQVAGPNQIRFEGARRRLLAALAAEDLEAGTERERPGESETGRSGRHRRSIEHQRAGVEQARGSSNLFQRSPPSRPRHHGHW